MQVKEASASGVTACGELRQALQLQAAGPRSDQRLVKLSNHHGAESPAGIVAAAALAVG